MSGVFVSYRRDDASGYAALVYAQLARRFGSSRVFMDVDTLRPGIDYGDEINSHVDGCDVLIALIGRRWLSAEDTDGRRRLDDPTDWVRSEVSAALARNVRVIPVLVDGASVPASTELPGPMAGLARREALQLSSRHTRQDLQRLTDAVAEELRTKRKGSWLGAHWRGTLDRWGSARVLGVTAAAALAIAVAIGLAVSLAGRGSSDLRQFVSSVDTILATSRRSRSQVSTVFTKLSTGARPTDLDLARIDDIVDNRRDLGAASRDLLAPTAAARDVRARLVASFRASLKQDAAIQRCARMTERSARRACMAATTSLNDSAAAEKNAFAESYNGLRNGLGLVPVSAIF